MTTKDFLIVALDFADFTSAKKLIDGLGDEISFYKVGMQLFYAGGFKTIDYLKQKNKKVFLDLKLNDIPATIGSAVTSLAQHEIDYLTLFTQSEQLLAAHEALAACSSSLKILNVTVLTSSAQGEDSFQQTIERAHMSFAAKAQGIICSGLETREVRKNTNADFLIINPGIRRQQDAQNDQKRIVTPRLALSEGASHIVVGRPVYRAADPLQAVREIFSELITTE